MAAWITRLDLRRRSATSSRSRSTPDRRTSQVNSPARPPAAAWSPCGPEAVRRRANLDRDVELLFGLATTRLLQPDVALPRRERYGLLRPVGPADPQRVRIARASHQRRR